MRVFVAGSTGALGRPLVPQLVSAGHRVTGLTRSAQKAAMLTDLGATPVVGNALDPLAMQSALSAGFDVVICALTDLPQTLDLRKLGDAYAANNRVRVEGTANVLAAARAAGVGRAIVESMAIWYAPDGPVPRSEDMPLYLTAPEPVGTGVRALDTMERSALASGLDTILLRYGAFYGPGTWLAPDGAMWTAVQNQKYPLIGDGEGVFSWIHVDDAAAATVSALDKGRTGTFNVVDDEPAATSEWLPAYATAIGAPPPRRVPLFLARMVGGGIVEFQKTIPPVSNARIKRELGWQPRHASWRTGFVNAL